MYLPRRHRLFAPTLGGQHQLWRFLLNWVALLALLLGSGAWAAGDMAFDAAQAVHALHAEHPGGGETTPEEETPAKPHRLISSRTQSDAHARAPQPALAMWITLQPQIPASRLTTVTYPIADPSPALPGRRVQRGQAPPCA